MHGLIDERIIQGVKQVNDLIHQAHLDLFYVWKNFTVFSWHWWLNVALAIVPWIIWSKVRKKESTHLLLYAATVIIILSCLMDFTGIAYGLWAYNSKILPLSPPYVPWDFTLLPVGCLLLYQFKPNISPFIKAIFLSGIASFIIQPFFEFIQMYDPKYWHHYYSFPIFILIYLVGHFITTRTSFARIQ